MRQLLTASIALLAWLAACGQGPDRAFEGLAGPVKKVVTIRYYDYTGSGEAPSPGEENYTYETLFDTDGYYADDNDVDVTRDDADRIIARGSGVYAQHYERDASGRVTGWTSQNPVDGDSSERYTFDPEGRVATRVYDGPECRLETRYTYYDSDSHGNWTRRLADETDDEDGATRTLEVRRITYF